MAIPKELESKNKIIVLQYIRDNLLQFTQNQLKIVKDVILKFDLEPGEWSYILLFNNPLGKFKEIQLRAVEKDGTLLREISNPSEDVKLWAIQNDQLGNTIRYVDNPSEKLQMIAFENHENAFTLMDNPTEKVQLMAVTQNPHLIEHIKNPSREVQLAALKRNQHIDKSKIDPDVFKEFLEWKKSRK